MTTVWSCPDMSSSRGSSAMDARNAAVILLVMNGGARTTSGEGRSQGTSKCHATAAELQGPLRSPRKNARSTVLPTWPAVVEPLVYPMAMVRTWENNVPCL